MDYLKHYLATKSTKQQQEFIQHMKRYLYMYMPNAGFEIADTRRYGGAGRRVEACVSVTKDWKVGDEMRLCTGMIAHLEPHQEHELKKGNRDISVMWSTRKQCNCLFLGPARFVNHDCEPNAKFISLGPNSVTFKIIKDIKCGDELTAFYGKHYFGENNCECRCATCETKRTGYFATECDNGGLSTDNEDECSYRRSSRKRKSIIRDDHLCHNKRSSMDISRIHQIELEELIGVQSDKSGMEEATVKMDEDDQHGDNNHRTAIKQEPQDDMRTANMVPIKQEHVGNDNDDERPKVMSIHFLCNENDNHQQQQEEDYSSSSSSRSSSFSHSRSPLDLLCNAVLDAEYLKVQPKQEEITVVVNPKIHRDATNRIMQRNDQHLDRHHHHHYQQQIHEDEHHQKWHSMDEESTSNTKADSAVGLSPDQDLYHQKTKTPPPLSANRVDKMATTNTSREPLSTTSAKRKSSQQQHDDDGDLDSLFDDDEQLSELDDFMDDVSDLSSVCSADSALDSDTSSGDDEKSVQLSPSSSSVNKQHVPRISSLSSLSSSTSTSTSSTSTTVPNNSNHIISNDHSNDDGNKLGLVCVVCDRALKSETVLDPSAVDVAVANELATWTWSPSAAFTDWRPQRCPRCERHVRVFDQEWPSRKIQKPTPSLFLTTSNSKSDPLMTSTSSSNKKKLKNKSNSMKKQPDNKKSISSSSSSTITSQYISKPATTRKSFLRSPPAPTSEIFDGMEDLF
ncbi:unnamed protein product [Absidia cylindrospora]